MNLGNWLVPAVTERLVADKAKKVDEAQEALTSAREALREAEMRHALARTFEEIVSDADLKTLALLGEYRRAQQTQLVATLGDDPTTWGNIDMSNFRAQSPQEWLYGKVVISSSELTRLLQQLRSNASAVLPENLCGENQLAEFAQLLVSRMYVDDNWPRLTVVDSGKLIIKEVFIAFEAQPDLR